MRRPSRPARPRPAKAPATGGWPAAAARPKPRSPSATQLKVYHALLSSPGTRYHDLGPDYHDRHASARRQIAHHVGKLGALGFEVTLCRLPEPDPDPEPGQADSHQAA